jgi:hypothetical protein
MAAYSPDATVEPNSQPQQVLVDIRWAKKAIAKVGRVLRKLLEPERNRERVDLFIQHGLLEQKDLNDVVKGLQQKIAETPSLFGVLLRDLSSFSSNEADGVVKQLQGSYEFKYMFYARVTVCMIKFTGCVYMYTMSVRVGPINF